MNRIKTFTQFIARKVLQLDNPKYFIKRKQNRIIFEHLIGERLMSLTLPNNTTSKATIALFVLKIESDDYLLSS